MQEFFFISNEWRALFALLVEKGIITEKEFSQKVEELRKVRTNKLDNDWTREIP
jgi:hypothetical protein